MAELRILDAGTVGAVRSQSLWHGIASAMSDDASPTLSFCRSNEPYVCIGYHRSLDELDLAACGELGLPVIRRQIGGGPVYIDSDQLFFQITLPAGQAPARIDRLYERYLGPAVTAFRALGLDAKLQGQNDIAVKGRKISGTGAGRIGDAVTVVGNVMFRFPHRKMAAVLALPAAAHDEYAALMARYVSSLEGEGLAGLEVDEARRALIDAYGAALQLHPVGSGLTAEEEARIAAWDIRLTDGKWLAGRSATAVPSGLSRWSFFRQVKVNAGVWLVVGRADDLELQVTIVEERFDKVIVSSPRFNGVGPAMGQALVGQPADGAAMRRCLEPFGANGRRLAELLEPSLVLR